MLSPEDVRVDSVRTSVYLQFFVTVTNLSFTKATEYICAGVWCPQLSVYGNISGPNAAFM